MAIIKNIIATDPNATRRTDAPEFIFEMSDAAAAHNGAVFAKYHFDFAAVLQAHATTPLGVGSEFRPASVLEPLLCRHALWPRFKAMLLSGAKVPLRPISRKDRLGDLAFHLARGNHKSASTNSSKLRELLNDNITHGFSLPLPISCLSHINNASLAPLGIVEQPTIDEFGQIVDKWRMTHDQTYCGPSATSVNRRTILEELHPCMYGFALLRLAHYIVDLRRRHPDKRIFIGKFDLKAAYRRAHLHPDTISECLTTFDNRLHAALRMTFRGAAFPSMWSDCSEIIGDLTNDLLACPEWNHREVYSPLQSSLLPPLRVDSDEPFAQAAEMSVTLPINDSGQREVYLDDIPPVCVDIGDNVERCAAAVPLALHIIGRSLHDTEAIPRDHILSVKKTRGEGRMEESKTFLGWLIRTRPLLLSLTIQKLTAWSRDISTALSGSSVTIKFMHTIVGRLNHVGFILPTSRHFLSRLRQIVTVGKQRGHKWGKLTDLHKADLRLWLLFLQKAYRGVSLNNIAHRVPTHHYRSDASQAGLGGYSITGGHAWRFQLPPGILSIVTLNTLEFIGCIITIWVDIIHQRLPPESCILSQTDSTSADGWLRKSNFDALLCPTQLIVARQLATLILQADCCLYSQWFPGSDNVVSDLLSRRFDLSDDALVTLICASAPSQVPFGIRICPLPTEIVSWLTSLWPTLANSTESLNKPTRPPPARGPAGISTSSSSACPTTPSSTSCPAENVIASSAPSAKPSVMPDSAQLDTMSSRAESSVPPLHTWHRPSGLTTGQIQDLTLTAKWLSFYADN
jgi:hypothetical protein